MVPDHFQYWCHKGQVKRSGGQQIPGDRLWELLMGYGMGYEMGMGIF